ncbi:acyltransferase family protein [Chryseobacterium sp. Leaf180]|uniref:acyltransferase family protein n=1 Tax=Chryseobacterium sp. Leaf180 TaxID=1736289 RepID=UPI000A681FE1|nr:acyltransferase [Chryseobacterium sp. Leaf180]
MNTKNDLSRQNSFDFIRLLLSSLVIISHSYPLTGNENQEILSNITNGQIDFGSFAVNGFFALSGYFIFQSLQRSENIANYIWKRLLRLYPALIVLFLFTGLLVPFLYQGNHLTSTLKNYWKFAADGLSLYNVKYFIPGIFGQNPYKGAVNGSLWTLAYEFSMYMVVMLFFTVRRNRMTSLLVFIAFVASYFFFAFKPDFLAITFKKLNLDTAQLYRLSTYFLAGSFLTFLPLKEWNTLLNRSILSLVLLTSLFAGLFQWVAPLVLPVLILLFGFLKSEKLSFFSEKLGDISYGVYIYGFLVQQIFMSYFELKPFPLMIFSLTVTYILAYLSWHLVEKKMLTFKNLVR